MNGTSVMSRYVPTIYLVKIQPANHLIIQGGQIGTPSTVWYPYCGWVDQDQTCGHQITAMQANMAAMQSNSTLSTLNKQELCNPPNLFWSVNTDLSWVNDPDSPYFPDMRKRNKNPCSKKRALYTSIVRSDIPSHNATELCMSRSSRGPDFISLHESVHCDMDTRKITPLCGNNSPSDLECFHFDEENQAGHSLLRNKSTMLKRYSDFQDWEHEQLHADMLARREITSKSALSSGSSVTWYQQLTKRFGRRTRS